MFLLSATTMGTDQVDNFNAPPLGTTSLYHSQSNPDITTSLCYEDIRDYPEHVLKVIIILKHLKDLNDLNIF